MKIFALSYSNIGPFAHRVLSIFIKDGKYLIQSPIGRGKSFLFFDGVIFALYGYSKRDMLNVESDDGFTKILFQNDDGDIFLIIRPLIGKKGASLYRFLGNDIGDLVSGYDDIIFPNVDFTDSLDMKLFEKIEFHRSSELQQHIDMLLPPRSVFLQRHIFMQSEENIFDLQPKARIEILKKMFGLDAIDVLRDSLSDMKNNLKGQLKVLQDSTHITDQYENYYKVASMNFKSFIERFDNQSDGIGMQNNSYSILSHITFEAMSDIVGVLRTYCDDPLIATIDSVSSELCDISLQVFSDYFDDLSKKQEEYIYNQTNIRLQLGQATQKIASLNDSIIQSNHLLTGVLSDLQQFNEKNKNYPLLEQQKNEYEKNIDLLNKLITSDIRKLILRYIDSEGKDFTIHDLVILQQTLLQIGNTRKSEGELAQQKLTQLLESIEHKKQSLDQYKQQLLFMEQTQRDAYIQKEKSEQRELELLIDQKNQSLASMESQKLEIEGSIRKLHSSLQYQCDKIQSPCPFIDAILHQNNLDQDNKILEEKKYACEQNMQIINQQLVDLQNKHLSKQNLFTSLRRDDFIYSGKDREEMSLLIQKISTGELSQSDQLQVAQLQATIKNNEKALYEVRSDYVIIRDILSEGIVEQFQEYSNKLISVNNELFSLQKQQQHYSGVLLKKQEYELQKEQAKKLISDIENEVYVHEQNLKNNDIQLQQITGCAIESLGNLLAQLRQDIRKLSDLFREKKRVSQESDIKKQELQYATLLHTIANKELVLYVLQSSLPLLTEYINNLLMKVVPFQLQMNIHEDGDELELFIVDDLGLREVKSLSGGQKTVLKLCRVLATSIVFRNTFLFLDETINNVDEEITSQLADMLLEYMRNYNLTFYTVSHSSQLQSMDIRDSIIHIPEMGN